MENPKLSREISELMTLWQDTFQRNIDNRLSKDLCNIFLYSLQQNLMAFETKVFVKAAKLVGDGKMTFVNSQVDIPATPTEANEIPHGIISNMQAR